MRIVMTRNNDMNVLPITYDYFYASDSILILSFFILNAYEKYILKYHIWLQAGRTRISFVAYRIFTLRIVACALSPQYIYIYIYICMRTIKNFV